MPPRKLLSFRHLAEIDFVGFGTLFQGKVRVQIVLKRFHIRVSATAYLEQLQHVILDYVINLEVYRKCSVRLKAFSHYTLMRI